MTHPPSGDTPDPYQPQQPYGSSPDPTTPYSQDPYAAPASGQPSSGQTGGYPPPSYPEPVAPQTGGYAPSPDPVSPQSYGADPYGPNQYGYGPNAYGASPYPAYGPQTRTNAMAVASLACSLGGLLTCVSAPLGIVFGHIAKRQIRETGEQGEGMATAGLWIGYIFTIIGVLFIAGWLALFIFLANVDGTPT
jgi:hypothetical protein